MASASASAAASAPASPVTTPADEPALHTRNRALLTLGVMAATIMQILDSTIANVALPNMQASLGATADTVTWVLTSYIVASAVAIPVTGWLADRIGSRNLFLISVVGFVLASMLCGLAQTLPEMVGFRILQGIAAAFMNPLSQTVMMDINKPSRQAGAMAVWGMGIMVGPVLGPVIGGYLTDNYDWRWVFYVNVPVGIACFAILWALLPSRPITARRFDLFGFSLLAIAIAAFQVMCDRGQSNDWFQSWEVLIEGLVSLTAAIMFVIHIATADHPMFDRDLLRNRNLMTGLGFMLVVGVLMMATMALLPPMLQGLFGYPVLDTGILLMPRGIGIVLSMAVAGQAIQRGIDPRILVSTGLVIAAWSLWDMAQWTLVMSTTPFIVVGFIQGIGLGLIFIPLNLAAFATLPPRYRTEASSLMNLARNIGASVGISMVTALLGYNIQSGHQDIGANLTSSSLSAVDPAMSSILGPTGQSVMMLMNAEVNRQAAMIAYLDDFRLMMILTLLAIPLVLLLKRPVTKLAKEDTPHAAFD
ncbi:MULTISPECIES: DHA2 family efflux MFS transporter permease subunit [unclassified Sphingomonas]|uniref:DHA2 family efflux MFS transporter permease subunit n=1 Tax=unclassified Sphingomonas TaxID=196159 RepID=UPI000BCDDA0E|nr:MAG: EmrB/QacA family drug resistance transporter [Sphingomonas sp. 12-62-6]OYX40234.1 MAG: EmrB/QacA family drug resistance transporter [Sphingomonas sp. 32-62-10]